MGKCAFSIKLLTFFANRTKEVKEEIEGTDTSIQFDIEGEKAFNIKIADGKLVMSNGRLTEPSATIKSKAEVFFKVMTQKIDPEEAFTKGKYVIEGSIIDAIRFRRIGDVTMKAHKRIFALLSRLAKVA